MDADKRRSLDDLTERIIGAAIEVSNELGSGFLEKVYENALVEELKRRGMHGVQQSRLQVLYKGVTVGDYVADVVVENQVLVELKCVDVIAPEHMAQCLNYLKATGITVCLLMNFQRPKLEVKRVVLGF